ncbi:MAG: type II toxin-antitoxin system VapC family toxin [Mesorhizobium sp.]|nr:type II toxin-antitoxin system VapC family toxin [Mesorhizobium sp.]
MTEKIWIGALIEYRTVNLVALEPDHAYVAVEAARRFGKGSGHRAQLNFGDCMSYAIAKQRDLPLLYTGNDYRHTDLTSALT